ncbi:unnamed protein product [Protopolystoma xenopodis]|uniref:Uncharacterized protein n=1 Tax=Protopolystoma xenopodis TaxID=117903 RepID=A0A448WDZ7_9PLAT|nr:unnamed protein product [Protopolystoma xenopodis]
MLVYTRRLHLMHRVECLINGLLTIENLDSPAKAIFRQYCLSDIVKSVFTENQRIDPSLFPCFTHRARLSFNSMDLLFDNTANRLAEPILSCQNEPSSQCPGPKFEPRLLVSTPHFKASSGKFTQPSQRPVQYQLPSTLETFHKGCLMPRPAHSSFADETKEEKRGEWKELVSWFHRRQQEGCLGAVVVYLCALPCDPDESLLSFRPSCYGHRQSSTP